jgi:hypothetical protein
VNVVEAEVNSLCGWLIVDLGGSPASVISALEWLIDRGTEVSVVSGEAT